MGFAGIPGVLIFHNDNLAWTTTSGLTDMEDVLVEQVTGNSNLCSIPRNSWSLKQGEDNSTQSRNPGTPITAWRCAPALNSAS